MTTVLALAGAAISIYLFWNLLTLPFAPGRRMRKLKKAGASFVAFLIFVIGFSVLLDMEAQKAGFESAGEQSLAKKAGITDPAIWAQRRDEILARERAAEAAMAAVALEKKQAEEQAAGERAQAEQEAASAAAAKLAAEDEFYAVGEQQSKFLNAIETARISMAAATNDLAKGGIRRTRQEALCAIVDGKRIQNWSGIITTLTTNGDGLGVVSIEIGDRVTFGTFNNALSDIGSDTLIDPAAAIFSKLSALKEGDRVRFSGSLFRDRGPDCFLEKSITMAGSMTSPDFVMRFESIEIFNP